MGLTWDEMFYVDLTLSFGAASACTIFTKVADLLMQIFQSVSPAALWFHYLDDFLAICAALHKEAEFSKDFACIVDLCAELGVPLAAGKSVDPCTRLIFLGLEIDTMEMTVSIPPGKRDRYASSLEELSSKRSERKRKLESALGKLFHAASVIPVGRAFLRPLINQVQIQGGPHPGCF